jgi:polyhydroxyalkanoate synthesis regulator phasin
LTAQDRHDSFTPRFADNIAVSGEIMAIKDSVIEGLGRLVQSEQAMKVLQNEAVMKAVMKAFSVSNEARSLIDNRLATMVKSLNLVTRDEIRGLQKAVERLERELGDLQARADEAIARAAEADDKAERAAGEARMQGVSAAYGAKPAAAKKPAAAPKAAATKRPASRAKKTKAE